jgi:hypothetical protein
VVSLTIGNFLAGSVRILSSKIQILSQIAIIPSYYSMGKSYVLTVYRVFKTLPKMEESDPEIF